ncbi:MAG TPA: hypothetical protein VFE48_19585 [Methylomirabilota bacterium]|nr:hypothetical protein [Methylomirabilota bacterium]
MTADATYVLVVAGLIATPFLFYVAVSGPAVELLHRMLRAESRLAVTRAARSAIALVRTTPK